MPKDRTVDSSYNPVTCAIEGGPRGGCVSEPETLPRVTVMGGVPTGPGANQEYGSFGIDNTPAISHGMGGHEVAGAPPGSIAAHGASSPRGGHYHCMAEGCSYHTRSKHGMVAHASQKNRKHSMSGGSSGASGSSPSMGSTSAQGSSTARGSS